MKKMLGSLGVVSTVLLGGCYDRIHLGAGLMCDTVEGRLRCGFPGIDEALTTQGAFSRVSGSDLHYCVVPEVVGGADHFFCTAFAGQAPQGRYALDSPLQAIASVADDSAASTCWLNTQAELGCEGSYLPASGFDVDRPRLLASTGASLCVLDNTGVNCFDSDLNKTSRSIALVEPVALAASADIACVINVHNDGDSLAFRPACDGITLPEMDTVMNIAVGEGFVCTLDMMRQARCFGERWTSEFGTNAEQWLALYNDANSTGVGAIQQLSAKAGVLCVVAGGDDGSTWQDCIGPDRAGFPSEIILQP